LFKQGLGEQLPNEGAEVEVTEPAVVVCGVLEQKGGKRPPGQKHVGAPFMSRHVALFKHGLLVVGHEVTAPPVTEPAAVEKMFGGRVTPFCGNSHREPEKFGRHVQMPRLPIVMHVPPLRQAPVKQIDKGESAVARLPGTVTVVAGARVAAPVEAVAVPL